MQVPKELIIVGDHLQKASITLSANVFPTSVLATEMSISVTSGTATLQQ